MSVVMFGGSEYCGFDERQCERGSEPRAENYCGSAPYADLVIDDLSGRATRGGITTRDPAIGQRRFFDRNRRRFSFRRRGGAVPPRGRDVAIRLGACR